MYNLDFNINEIMSVLEKSNNPILVKKHFDKVDSLLLEYEELTNLGVKFDVSFDREFMQKLAESLFNKYCMLV